MASSSLKSIDPTKIYSINNQTCPLLCKPNSGIAIANNTSVIAAISGSVIRVMGLVAQSTGAGVSGFTLKSASGGTVIFGQVSANSNALAPFLLPITDSGYFETTVSQGLFVDVVTTTLNLSVFYITYIPQLA